LKTQHQIILVIINKVDFVKNKIFAYKCKSEKKTEVFITIVLRCSHWNLLIFMLVM